MERVRRLAGDADRHVTIMGDLQGPKFRIGGVPNAGLPISNGQRLVLNADAAAAEFTSAEMVVPFPHPEVIAACQPGQLLLIDDGVLVLRAIELPAPGQVRCEVMVGGVLLSRKGVSAPGTKIEVSSLTPKDRADVTFAVQSGVDAVALSFVQQAADVVELRTLVRQLGGDPILVAKIEKPQALQDLEQIILASDVVMVARGDLGVECPAEEVPFHQKRIIRSCLRAGVPVITATQMLQSMVHTPSPTRAEATDVANAVLDGTDAVMLSAETASGDYPVEALQTLARIAQKAEQHQMSQHSFFNEVEFLKTNSAAGPNLSTVAITAAAVRVAGEVNAKAIVCTTSSGYTARMVARHRPDQPIICLTPNPRAHRYSAFIWGVRSIVEPLTSVTEHMFEAAARVAKEQNLAQTGDAIVITAGVPMGKGSGHTNLIKVPLCE
jgi:pyruvate kinase